MYGKNPHVGWRNEGIRAILICMELNHGRVLALAISLIGVAPLARTAEVPRAADRPALALGAPNNRLAPSGYDLARSPGGRIFAVRTYDGTVYVIDARTVSVLRRIEARAETSFAFVSDRILAVSTGAVVALWDAATGTLLRSLREGDDDMLSAVSSIAASRDGRLLAFSTFQSSISIVEVESGRELTAVPELVMEDGASGFDFSPDGKRLVVSDWAGSLVGWDLERSTVAWRVRVYGGERPLVSWGVAGPHYGASKTVFHRAFSPDGRRLAIGGPDEQVILLNAHTGRHIWTGKPYQYALGSLAFTPDGKGVLSGHADGRIRRMDARTGAEKHLATASERIDGFAFDREGGRLLTLEQGGFIGVRDLATGAASRRGMTREVWDSVFSPDESLLAVADSDGVIELYAMPGGKLRRRIESGMDGVGSLAFSPDGHRLAANGGRRVLVWDVGTGAVLWSTRLPKFRAGLAFSPDGERLLIANGKSVAERSARTGASLSTFGSAAEDLMNLAVSPDGRYAAAGGDDGRLYLWERGSGRVLFRHPEKGAEYTWMEDAAFAERGAELVGRDRNHGTLYRLSVPDGRVLEERDLIGCVRKAAVSADGRIVLSNDDGRLTNWRVSSIGRDGGGPTPHQNLSDAGQLMGVSPTGRWWLTAGADGILSVWPAPLAAPRSRAVK